MKNRDKKEEIRGKKGDGKFVFLLISSFFLLSACGFHPMYGKNKYTPVGAEEAFEFIEIGNIPDREGQYLRNALIDRFYRNGRPEQIIMKLSVSGVRETLRELDITKSSDATRGQLQLNTTMKLIRARSGEVLLERDLRATTSYNILSSEFATRVSEDNARLNGLNDLARQIEMQVALYLKKVSS